MAIQDDVDDQVAALKEQLSSLEHKTAFEEAAQSIFRISDAHEVIPAVPEGKIKLDIACGQKRKEGWVGLDRVPGEHVDVVHDVTIRPWPIETDHVSEAEARHIVEHLTDLVGFMEEIYRVLMPGGLVLIVCPYYSHVRAWQDPTHVRGINEGTFQYFNKKNLKALEMDHYPFQCDFDLVSIKEIVEPAWEPRAVEARKWAARHLNNVIMDLEIVLRAVKPMRVIE